MFAEVLVVFCNAPSEEVAHSIAGSLVQERLAACVNVLAPCRSVYRWEGKMEQASEVPLLIKTTRDRYPLLEAALRRLHPYDVPEILALPVAGGSDAYLRWVVAQTHEEASGG
jgi:periplasmic divalent cation tolerance protein